jgi:acetyltransferase
VQLIRSGADSEVLLHNRSIATIRDVTSAEAADVGRFMHNLSPSSRYLRFLMAVREFPEEMLRRFTHPAKDHEVVLVASTATSGIVGITQYVVDDDEEGCEFAVVVGDAWQRQGLGYRMLQALSRVAMDNGVRYGHADVLADNYAMRSLASKLGCEIRTNAESPFLLEIRKHFDGSDAVRLGPSPGRCGGARYDEAAISHGR